ARSECPSQPACATAARTTAAAAAAALHKDQREGTGPSRGAGALACLAAGGGEALGDLVPVDHVPPGLDVGRAAVLVLEVVGMLPDVQAHDRVEAVHQGAVLVRRAHDLELAVAPYQPGPAAAEAPEGCLGELVLEGGEVTERLLDGVRKLTGRLATLVRAHDLPEHGVVDRTAPVVADGSADVLRHLVDVAQNFLGAHVLQVGVTLDGVVVVVDIGHVVVVVVVAHGRFVDMRLQRVVRVGQLDRLVGHNLPSLVTIDQPCGPSALVPGTVAPPIITQDGSETRPYALLCV